jgi:molybdopterin synthase catalytic subunit
VEANYLHITNETIDLVKLLSISHLPSAGAVVLFSGEVRDENIGKKVNYIEYECFESLAEKMIAEIIREAVSKWDLEYALCQHRIGKVEIMESAVCVITASVHRKEAFEANQYIIGRVKHEVPIWKKEFFEDGSYAWGNNCNCPDPKNHDWKK